MSQCFLSLLFLCYFFEKENLKVGDAKTSYHQFAIVIMREKKLILRARTLMRAFEEVELLLLVRFFMVEKTNVEL